MRKKQLRPGNAGFTLIELVIVMVIMGLLFGVIFQSYRIITEVSLRLRHQKDLAVQIVSAQAMLQNIIDSTTIDYEQIATKNRETPGYTNVLPLIDRETNEKSSLEITSDGNLFWKKAGGDKESVSIMGNQILFTQGTFILSPHRNPDISRCRESRDECFQNIVHPGFWIVGRVSLTTNPNMTIPRQTFYSFLQ